MQQALNQDVFDMSVLINNSRDSEVTEMMTNVIEVLKDPEFVKYFTVDVGNALEVFEEELSDQAALNRSQTEDATSEEKAKRSKKVELGIAIMKCQPSSRSYCEDTTRDLFRLFQQYLLPQKKFGSINNFVCEFIQAKNGIIFFN